MTTPQRLTAQGYVQGEPYTRPDGLTITPWYGETVVLVQTLLDGTDICYAPLPQQEGMA